MLRVLREDLNFLITNRIPRRFANRMARWFAGIESPTLTRVSIPVWSWFAGDLELHDAERTSFRSVRECFTRKLRPGAREVVPDRDVVVSPCDAIVGASGRIDGFTMIQAKGLSYTLDELVGDRATADQHRDGFFVTLRLRSSMYHRFHAPLDATLRSVRFIFGDTWNVNPIAVRRIERLFCRNERLVLEFEVADPRVCMTLVPVAAILVSRMHVEGMPAAFDAAYAGPPVIRCSRAVRRGDELGYFENGSTIVALFAGHVDLHPSVQKDSLIRMGQPLLRILDAPPLPSSPDPHQP
ncbi:MAG: archaetidylserine decarboxylase [Gemmatimonas sp.]